MRFPNLTPLLNLQFLFSNFTDTTDNNPTPIQNPLNNAPESITANKMSSAFHFSELLSSLSKARLQPGPLVPEGWKPSTELKISFSGKDVRLGNYFKTKETAEKPVVEFALEVCFLSSFPTSNRICKLPKLPRSRDFEITQILLEYKPFIFSRESKADSLCIVCDIGCTRRHIHPSPR